MRISGIFFVIAWSLLVTSLSAQSYTFTRVGLVTVGSDDGPGLQARFDQAYSVAPDRNGNVYVVDRGNHTIRKINSRGEVTTFAGLAGKTGAVDGTGSAARFFYPEAVAVDPSGIVYVSDTGNNTVRKITPDGVVTTFTGAPGSWGGMDGAGPDARFRGPEGLALDAAGNLYVADRGNSAIRKITPAGVVSTVAGQLNVPGSADGPASTAQFNGPKGIAFDAGGNMYVADADNYVIRKVTPAGLVSTYAGAVGSRGMSDGSGEAARFYYPLRVAVDSAGAVYVVEMGYDHIRKIDAARQVSSWAGAGPGNNDGNLSSARFWYPSDLAFDSSGVMFVSETRNNTVRRISGGTVTTVAGPAGIFAGTSTSGGIQFQSPMGVVGDAVGNLYVAESDGGIISKIAPNNTVSVLAGSSRVLDLQDGTGAAARFYWPDGIGLDSSGNLIVGDRGNSAIRRVTPAGVVTTIAGSPQREFGLVDGTGAAARFYSPVGVAVDGVGNIYVAEVGNSVIRRITPAGVVTTFAGAGAGFSNPRSLAIDRAGNLFVADTNNNAIRKITPAGSVSTFAGALGAQGYVDGVGASARFGLPAGISIDRDDQLYVTEIVGGRIRRITSAGVVTTISALSASGATVTFNSPYGIFSDRFGNLTVCDTHNNLVWRGSLRNAAAPVFSQQPIARAVPIGGTVTFSVAASGTPAPEYRWQRQAAGGSAFVDLSDGGGFSGTSTASLTLSGATVAQDGEQFRCTVYNGVGRTVTSSSATLTVSPTTVFTSPERATFVRGVPGTFNLVATGKPRPTVVVVSGSLPAWLQLNAVLGTLSGTPPLHGPASYSVTLEASNGVTIPATQMLTVDVVAMPAIATQPVNVAANVGTTAVLVVAPQDSVGVRYQWQKGGQPVADGGNVFGATTPVLVIGRAQPSDAGAYTVVLTTAAGSVTSAVASVSVTTPPIIVTPPLTQTVSLGSAATFSVSATGAPPLLYQWMLNGRPITGATAASLVVDPVVVGSCGTYSVQVSDASGTMVSPPALLGLASPAKLTGSGTEVGPDIVHPNGNVYDQVLLAGAALTVTADSNQVLRISCLDLSEDIVQVEFAGAGTLSLAMENISGPSGPTKYRQAVDYMKGHLGLTITGADETTNIAVFSVGRANAVNPALFRDDVTYDGFADLAFIAIASRNGRFGGVRTGNASYFATTGFTGIYAPGVQFTGPVIVGDIRAANDARPVLILGQVDEVRIAGGDLAQANGRPVEVSGMTRVRMADGASSHGALQPASQNQARLERDNENVTAQLVVNP